MNNLDNPLSKRNGLPQFDKIKAEDFVPAVKEVFENTEKTLEILEKNAKPTWDSLHKPFEKIDLDYEYTWNVLCHLKSVKSSDAIRKAYNDLMPESTRVSLKVSQSKIVYENWKKLKDSPEYEKLNDAQKRIVDSQIKSAEKSGIALKGKKRERFNEIVKELNDLSNKFANNVLDSVKAYGLLITDKKDTEGWPDSLKKITANSWKNKQEDKNAIADYENGPWLVTLDAPSCIPFMRYSQNREQRRTLLHASTNKASSGDFDNREIIKQILRLRKEKANLLGYKNFVDYSLSSKMAQKYEIVQAMIDELANAAAPIAKKEQEQLQKFANDNGFEGELQPWDIMYWSEKQREKLFSYTEEQLRPYFPMPQVLNAMFDVCHKLFGITIKPSNYSPIPVWHEDVKFFNIYDENDNLIAHFFLDPFSRPSEKRGGAWMNTCRNRRIIDGKVINPVIYVVCNGTPAMGGKPSLMSFDEVNTLFHEFGHALQGMLTTVDISDAAGVSGIEWDAVELASQFMENWCMDHDTLMDMARHYETGEQLPEELYQKLKESQLYRAAYCMQRQLTFAKIDLYLHSEYDPDGKETPFEAYQRIASETCVLKPYEKDNFLCAFTHIFAGGYAAGYYSYKWAEVLSADAFGAFLEVGLNNKEAVAETGKRFRNTILALGGSKHPAEVYRMFRGRDATTKALLAQTLGI